MAHKIVLTAASAAAVIALAAPAVRAQNLLVNGSFEEPASGGGNEILPGGSAAITGWTTLLNGVERFAPPVFGVGAARDGALVVDICPFTFTGGGIQQTFATTPGLTYRLEFAAGTSTASGRSGAAIIEAIVGPETRTFNLANPSAVIAWQDFAIDFVADSASTTLAFRNTQDANTHFAFIDAVSVTRPSAAAVPEPGTLVLLAVSATVCCSPLVRRGRKGA
jgi:hypothetical protein